MSLLRRLLGLKGEKSQDKESIDMPTGDFYQINAKGSELEKAGNISKAIEIYELGLQNKSDTPHTYKRLAILYRKNNDVENELRVIDCAIDNLKTVSSRHIKWFKERRSKLN